MLAMRRPLVTLLVSVLVYAVMFDHDDAEARKRRRRSRRSPRSRLTIKSTTSGAEVFIDGKKKGRLPLKPFRLRPGSYRVTVRKLGYLKYNNTVKIIRRKGTSLMVDLLPVAVVLWATANVQGAKLYVNGIEKGVLPTKIELKSGAYLVEIKAPGYLTFTKEVLLQDLGQEHAIKATMERDMLGSVAMTDDPLALEPISALALEPLPPEKEPAAPASAGKGPAGDDPLALEPLALSLEPLPDKAHTPASTGKGPAGEDPLSLEPLALEPLALELLSLEPLEPPPDSSGASVKTLLAAPVFVADSSITPPHSALQVERKWGRGPQWWNHWWVWTIATAVVVGGSVTAGMLSRNDDSSERATDIEWTSGTGIFTWLKP